MYGSMHSQCYVHVDLMDPCRLTRFDGLPTIRHILTVITNNLVLYLLTTNCLQGRDRHKDFDELRYIVNIFLKLKLFLILVPQEE